MKVKSLLVMLALSASSAVFATQQAGPPAHNEQLQKVIDQARKDGAIVVECTAGRCWDKDTYAPMTEYEGSEDGIYLDMVDPAHDSYQLLDEAMRIVEETKAKANGN